MLQMYLLPQDDKAAEIVKKFVNDRLIGIMEEIILDEVDWELAVKGELDEVDEGASFEDVVDIDALMDDAEFASEVAFWYFPDGYPLERVNQEFFGLYKLLKADKEYTPALPMEYALFQIIQSQINQVDQINEDTEDGLFDGLAEDPFFEGIEDEVYDTIMHISEPDRSVVLSALEKESDESGMSAEEMITLYEDLREYDEVCFEDTDFAFLDDFDEETLVNSDMGKKLGIRKGTDGKKMEIELKEDEVFLSRAQAKKVSFEFNVGPWDLE